MLYESTYNQYFLEHSWGPWKKHLYISRDGESGKYTYKYPKEYYEKYRPWKKERAKYVENFVTDKDRAADENSEYYNEYYSDFDKVINRSVKKAVDALNFAHDTRVKAEGYLNRFANAVKDAWNGAKSPDRTRIQAGKKFIGDLWDYAKNTVTTKRISSSIQNLVQGAGEAISKTWNDTKEKTKTTLTTAKNKLLNTKGKVKASSKEVNSSIAETIKKNKKQTNVLV